MIFNYIENNEHLNNENIKRNYREAVRAVVLNGESILMVHTNKGDYKLPGGGINHGETHEEAIKREVKEETGYIVRNIAEKIGIFTEIKPDEFEENSIFEMVSYYYECEVGEEQTTQQLDDYEYDMNFKPQWILLDEAINQNEKLIEDKSTYKNRWIHRETKILKSIKQHYSVFK